jgi:kynurenine formamidase
VVFPLSLPLDYPRGGVAVPPRHPPVLDPTGAYNTQISALSRDVFCDDKVLMCLQFSTQWDALSHVGAVFDADDDGIAEMVYYNGYRAEEHILSNRAGHPHAAALGIETMAESCVQGRGVLIDLHACYGNQQVAVGYEEMMRICEVQRVTVETGDILCLNTGLTGLVLDHGDDLTRKVMDESCAVLNGGDARLLRWISDSGIAAIAADNVGVEIFPPAGSTDLLLPLHHHCIFKIGLPLGELWYFRDLAAWLRQHGRSRFLLTAPPLRLPGAVGSPVSAVATV